MGQNVQPQLDRLALVPLGDAVRDIRPARRRVVAATLLFALLIVGAFLVLARIESQLDRTETVQSDNWTWNLSQIENELLRYGNALASELTIARGDFEQIRIAYDVLYARVVRTAESRKPEDLRLDEYEGWVALAGGDGLLARHLSLIDAPDDRLAAALPAMFADYEATVGPVRAAVVQAFQKTVSRSAAVRTELRSTLHLFSVSALGTLAVLFAFIAAIQLRARERHRHSLILEVAVNNLRATLDSSLDAVLIFDGTGSVVGANYVGQLTFGLGGRDGRQGRIEEIVSFDGVPLTIRRARSLPRRLRATGRRSDGTEFPTDISLAWSGSSMRQDFLIAFLRDISDQVQHEQSLAAARNAAMQADKAKARFLAVMSHEMRTPLNGLMAAVALLGRAAQFRGEEQRLVEIIRSCADATLDQVNNVLELTRLGQRGAADYPVGPIPLQETLLGIVHQFEAVAVGRGVALSFHADPAAAALVFEAPPPLFRRVIANLLSNAVKFTQSGSIEVAAFVEPSGEPGSRRVRIAVADTGIGIARADLERIFHNFETLDASYARVQEGSGLGLGIAKLSAEAMGGRIEVESELGHGSTFTFLFEPRVAETAAVVVEPSPKPRFGPLDLLLAEDNAISRDLLRRQLELEGHRVTVAKDGQEALAIGAGRRFDAILMDAAMPRMDGLAASAALRRAGACMDVPILGLTAQAEAARKAQLRAAGMDMVLVKPVAIVRLNEALAELIEGRTPSDGSDAQPAGLAFDTDEADLLDPEQIGDLLDGLGAGQVESMIRAFLGELEEMLNEMDRLLDASRLGAVGQFAHRQAGAAAVLGLRGLRDALLSQMQAADAGNLDLARAAQTSLNALLDETNARLSDLLGCYARELQKTG